MLLSPGSLLDCYQVDGLIGAGGIAEVWSARHRDTGERVALKVLLTADTEQQERLRAEGQAQSVLHHPGILPVLRVLEVGGRPMLVLPFIAGPSLSELLSAYRPTLAESVALLSAITTGLAFAHRQGFVHRDLKPGNVLIDTSADRLQPRIADFGLVKDAGSPLRTRTGMVFGTPAYAAPEQLLDASSVDHRADLFSLGVLAVLVLTGKRPFAGSNIAELARAHRAPPLLTGIAPSLNALVVDLLCIDPAGRPASAETVLARLEAPDVQALEPGSPLSQAARRLCRTPPVVDPVADTLPPRQHYTASPEPDFIGREHELDLLRAWRADPAREPLLTLTGTAGTGKTRLVSEFAERSQWPGGVIVCRLETARDVATMRRMVAEALGIVADSRDGDALASAIAGRAGALLVLDNVEQLVGVGGAALLADWIVRAPLISVLVTSRVPLGIPGERVVQLDILSSAAAARLFARRALEAGRRCSPEDPEVIALVAMLDCLPLAIELAAARARLFAPQALRQRLSQRFRLLTSRVRQLPDRRRSLQGALLWSWELLSADMQQLLAQCCVFAGPFSMDWAESILRPTDGDLWLEDALTDLLEHGWLRRLPGERLGMLVSIREFTSARLDTPEAQERHSAYFARHGSDSDALSEQVLATRRAITGGNVGRAVATARRAAETFQHQGPFGEGIDLLRAVLAMPGLDAPSRGALQVEMGGLMAKSGVDEEAQRVLRAVIPHGGLLAAEAHIYLGQILRNLPRYDEADAHFTHALTLSRACDDSPMIAKSLLEQGVILSLQHHYAEAEVRLDEAIRACRELGDLRTLATALGARGGNLLHLGRPAEGEASMLEALACCAEQGTFAQECSIRSNLAIIYDSIGRAEDAHAQLLQALQCSRYTGNRRWECSIRCNLGMIYSQATMRDLDRAAESYHAAMQISRELGDTQNEAIVLNNLAELLAEQGQLQSACEHLRAAVPIADGLSATMAAFFRCNLGAILARQGELAEGRALLEAGVAVLEENKEAYLIIGAMFNGIQLELCAGDRAAALSLVAETGGRMDAIGMSASSDRRVLLADLEAQARALPDQGA